MNKSLIKQNSIIKINSNINTSVLRIELCLSNICNYACWYCFPGCNEGTHPWPKYKTFIDNFNHLINYYKTHQNKKTIYVHIIGGEPTLWREFGDFVKYLKEQLNCIVSISTNGSRTLRWWEEYGHYVDSVVLSCHYERIDVDHVKAVGDILYKKGVNVTALVLMDPKNWDTCVSIVERLKTSKKRWFILTSEIYHHSIKYTEEQKKYLSRACKRIANLWFYFRYHRHPSANPTVIFENKSKSKVSNNWLSINKLNNFYGWECNLGVDTFYIEKNGLMQGACGEPLYGLNYKFNIYDEDFKLKFHPEIKPTICRKNDFCQCQPEYNCRKQKTIPLVQV